MADNVSILQFSFKKCVKQNESDIRIRIDSVCRFEHFIFFGDQKIASNCPKCE